MDTKKSGFELIEQYCQEHEKTTLTRYVTYCVYKGTFLKTISQELEKAGGNKLTSKDFQRLKEAQLHADHIERYVKQAEEMLEEMVERVQKEILESHQQELKKIVQKTNRWDEFWFTVLTSIAANLIYWALALVFFLVFKDQLVSLL
jgi:hypothetical protein